MPDLTVEYYWACKELCDDVHIRHSDPDHENRGCTWCEFTHDEKLIEDENGRRCPICGGEVSSLGFGV